MSYRLRSIVIALALAIVAAMLVSYYVTSYKKRVQRGQATVPVVVAARDFDVGTAGADILAQSGLKIEAVPRTAIVPGALTNPTQVSGQFVTEPIYAGEQVTAHRFGKVAPVGVRSDLKGRYRAIEVPGDGEALLAGTLQPGDHVDVVASIKYKVRDVDVKRLAAAASGGPASGNSADDSSSNEQDRVAVRTVLRNIKVLETSGNASGSKLTSPGSNDWVILAVTDGEAQKLYWVMRNADWSLTLRPVLGGSDSPNTVETVQSVLADGIRLKQYVQLWLGRTPSQ
jgi:pilus assembly protein CpaB